MIPRRRRDNAQSIDDLLNRFLRDNGLETPLQLDRAKRAWFELSPMISKYTQEVYIRGDVMYVHLKSAPLRQELLMAKDMIIKQINRTVKAQVIRDIVLR